MGMLKIFKDKQFYLYHMPVILLLGVALNQIAMSRFMTLTPWKGGGYAMFARITERGIACEAIDQMDRKVMCRIRFRGKGELGPLTRLYKKSLRNRPTVGKLKDLAKKYLGYKIKVSKNEIIDERGYASTLYKNSKIYLGKNAKSPFKALKLSLYELVFDDKTTKITKIPMGIEYIWGRWY